MSNENRKNTYVEKRVQGALARRVVLHFCVFIVAGAFLGLIVQFFTNPFQDMSTLFSAFWGNTGPYLVALVCLLPIFVKDTLKLSHRIAGPICRLQTTIDSIANGKETPKLEFRKGDMWSDLPERFNAMVGQLQGTNNGRANEADLDQIEQIVESDAPAEAK